MKHTFSVCVRSPWPHRVLVGIAGGVLAVSGLGCSADDPELDRHSDPVVFGSDDRLEYGGITSSRDLRLANATAAQFFGDDLTCSGGTCDLETVPFTVAQTNSSDRTLCNSEPLKNQEKGANCTVFLIGPKLFATAGHCMDCSSTFGDCLASTCAATRVVFGFTADAGGNNEVTTVPESEIYSCTSARGTWDDIALEDFAIFEVDRIVTGHIPLLVRYSSNLAVGDDLLVTGHPDGLPLKLAANGEVKQDLGTVNFGTSLDAFAGNSGSPVFNYISGVVEGIHVRRPYWHYLYNAAGNCAQTNVCSTSTGCNPNFNVSPWAQATRFAWAESQRNVPLHTALVGTVL
jgi:V8-like Glu-specific endopeptidase